MSLRYGAKVIELAKGRNAIEVGSLDKLVPTLEAVKKAVLGGELDSQIAATAEAVRARFKRRADVSYSATPRKLAWCDSLLRLIYFV